MQYTLRDVPPEVDRALRAKAKREGRSLASVALEALARGAGASRPAQRRRDLRKIAGSWVEDPETDRVLADQRKIDRHLWK